MNKSVKGIAIAAAAMVTVGLILTGIGYMIGGHQNIYLDRSGIHVGDREGRGTAGGDLVSFSESVDGFSSISVDLDYYDVDLVPGDQFAVQGAYSGEEGKPDIQIENDTLVIEDKSNKVLNLDIDLPGLVFQDDQPNIKIYYPEDTELKSIVIHTDASDLKFENLTAEEIEFQLDFGKLELSNITANNITVDMDSGDCTMKGIKAADSLNVKNDFGKTTLDGAEMKSLKLDADSGDVTLTETIFEHGDLTLNFGKLTAKGMKSKGLKTVSDSGDVDLQGELLGLTDVTCDMGKITIRPGAQKEQFNYELNTEMGSVSIEERKVSGGMVVNNAKAPNTLKVTADMGDINVIFK